MPAAGCLPWLAGGNCMCKPMPYLAVQLQRTCHGHRRLLCCTGTQLLAGPGRRLYLPMTLAGIATLLCLSWYHQTVRKTRWLTQHLMLCLMSVSASGCTAYSPTPTHPHQLVLLPGDTSASSAAWPRMQAAAAWYQCTASLR